MPEKTYELPDIFSAAIAVGNEKERDDLIERMTTDRPELRAQVNELLNAHHAANSFLSNPPRELERTQFQRGRSNNESVLTSLKSEFSLSPVVLRDESGDINDPVLRPNSTELPNRDANDKYQLQGEIARGGMGAVLRGRDSDLGRDLAVKVLLDAHKDKPEVVQRFVEEAQIGGQLQHPGIAPVYELGQFADQRPFFSMKLVKGDTLSKLLLDRDDPMADRSKLIGIFEQVCQTMAYAHSRGVIHRDLKPANIMVGAFGEVQVMDWGLAKVLAVGGVADEKATRKKQNGETLIQTMRSAGSDAPGTIGSVGSETQMGSVMGTPAYMPPEQALGEIDMLDQRADVFGLGAILAEILTGKPPYVADDGTQIYRMASRGKLGDCFTRLDECGADDELTSLAKQCLEVEPADRPKDANALADQVTGYLESVETKLRNAEVQRARFRVTLGLGAAALAILVAGIAATAWQANEANKQTLVAQGARTEATNERDKARESEQEAVNAKNAAEEERKAAEKAQAAAEEAKLREQAIARQRRRELYASDMQLADQLYKGQNSEQKRIEQILASWIPVDDEEDLREFSWRYQWNRLQESADTVVPECKGVAITPENKMVVTDASGLHEVDENGKKHELISWTLEAPDSWFSPDGRWVAAKFESGFDLYHIESRTKALSLPLASACSFSSNGKYFAAWNNGAQVDSLAPDEDAIPVWQLDGENTQPIAPLVIGDMEKLPATAETLKLGNDGKSFLLLERSNSNNDYKVAAFLDGIPKPSRWRNRGWGKFAWSPDGRIIASTAVGGGIDLRLTSDVTEKRTLQKLTFSSHGKLNTTPRFTPNGKLLATIGTDGSIDLWDVSALADAARRFDIQRQERSKEGDAGEPSIESVSPPHLVRTIKGVTNQTSPNAALGFSTDGGQLVALTLPFPGIARRWSLDNVRGKYEIDRITENLYGWTVPFDLRPSEARGADWVIGEIRADDIVKGNVDSNERIVAVFDDEKSDWFPVSGAETLQGFFKRIHGSSGSLVRCELVNSGGEKHEVTFRRNRQPSIQSAISGSVAFAPDEESVILSDGVLGATQLNLKTNEAIRYPDKGISAAYSPDGRMVAIAVKYAISIRDARSGTELYQLDTVNDADGKLDSGYGRLAFSPDGKFLAHTSIYGFISSRTDLNVWRTSDFEKIGGGPLHQEDTGMMAIVFSPDNSRLLVGDELGRVHFWDTADWTKQETLKISQGGVSSLAYSSDGKRLVTSSVSLATLSGDVCIWDSATRKLLRKLRSPAIGGLALSPDDRTLAVGCLNNNVVLWDLETGKQLQTIRAHSDGIWSVAFSNDGNRLATLSIDGVLRFWDATSSAEIEQAPKTLLALLRLGLWRFEQKRFAEAEALFLKVVELNRQSGGPIDSELQKARWKITQTLQQTTKWPLYVKQPESVGVKLGGQATLTTKLRDGDFAYQWHYEGHPIEGETESTLTLSSVTAEDIGAYDLEITPKGYESVASTKSTTAFVYDVAAPVLTGSLLCEIFNNIPGKTVEELTAAGAFQDNMPTYQRRLANWEGPFEYGGNSFGIRVSGYLVPPKTGEYVFFFACDDEGELSISSDESTDNLETIASVKLGPSGVGNESGRTTRRAWGKNPSAVSEPISLEAGKRYAVRVLGKQDRMAHHFSVTWQMPGDPPPKTGAPPIPGEYLEFEVE